MGLPVQDSGVPFGKLPWEVFQLMMSYLVYLMAGVHFKIS